MEAILGGFRPDAVIFSAKVESIFWCILVLEASLKEGTYQTGQFYSIKLALLVIGNRRGSLNRAEELSDP